MNIKNMLVLFMLVLSSLCLNASLAKADGWKYCATEGDVCSFDGTAAVRYGLNGSYNTGTFTNSVDCNNISFGDPVVGSLKTCEVYFKDNPANNGAVQNAAQPVQAQPVQAQPAKAQPVAGPAPAQNASSSYDANNNVLTSTMCNAMRLVTGNAGKAFAAFAIISLGIGFFTGKVSWGLMIGVAMGIAAMFGAPTIVAALTGHDAFDCGG